MKNYLVISPHPDDELIGCGGTLLRRGAEGAEVGWLITTAISKEHGWSADQVRERNQEIKKVQNGLGIHEDHLFRLGFPTTQLDTIPIGDLICKISEVFQVFRPEEVLVPSRVDVHSDHRIVFDAVAACTKWFRYPSVKRVLTYETLSETDFSLRSDNRFHPSVFIDITNYLGKKMELLKIYKSELGEFPFPRSEKTIQSLAFLRGSQAGFQAAEAFQLLYERL